MNNYGKTKIRKRRRTSKPGNILLFILIFLLSISTLITIQIRSVKKNRQIAEQSTQTSVYEYADDTLDTENITPSAEDEITKTHPDQEEQHIDDTNNADTEAQIISPMEPDDVKYTMPVDGKLTKAFSKTKLVYSVSMNDWRLHLGTDIECAVNSDIKAMAEGKIYDIYQDKEYGNTIVIEHNDGVMTKYSNVDINQELTFGSRVEQGTVLGTAVANPPCERLDTQHIHIEAFADDVLIDPLSLINN